MRLLFLGTGTSTGVPQIGCRCETCTSIDPCDKRLRASAILSVDGKNLLIDCGPDFRTQVLTANSPRLDALLVTHIHYDHVGGIDDLRPYCKSGPFPIYCQADVAAAIKRAVPYCFVEHPYPGVPTFDMHTIEPCKPFEPFPGIEVTPIPVMHYKLQILGIRVRNFAYITDCKTMSDESFALLQGVDTLVINALRHEEHMSHMNLTQAIEAARRIGAKRVYFTHMSHQIGPAARLEFPAGMQLAHDFMTIDC